MHADVARLDLLLRRRSLIAYTVGMALYALVIVALYPAFRTNTSLNDLTKGHSAAAALFGLIGPLTSPAGWLDANVFANFFPLVMLLLTIGYGASAIAGQDEDGTLCLVAVLPVRRDLVIVQKAATMVAQALVLTCGVAGIALLGRLFQVDVPPAHLLSVCASTLLMGVDFGLVALAVAAASGRRGVAIGVGAVLAAASYLVSSLAPVVAWIRPARFGSLLYWAVANDQVAKGVSGADVGVLVAVGLCALAAAVIRFRWLDLR